MSANCGSELREAIAARLRMFERVPHREEGLKAAAVAITVTVEAEGPAFLLTRRAARLNAHPGQWALPGGRIDPGESAVEAALRELDEELGLRRGGADVLGILDDYPTRSGYAITPVVVWGGPAPALAPSPAEVASVHRISFSELDQPGSPEFDTIAESDRPVVRLLIGESHVHAPTAAVLYQFREAALHGRLVRVAELEQPVWAWR